jgi:small subunit ribosomal protein S16
MSCRRAKQTKLMLTIRLSRIGKKNKPMYRLIISEKAKDPYGRSLEILGSYNPHNKELKANTEKINYWIQKGSGISPTANNLLIEKGIIKGTKLKASKLNKKAAEKKAAEDAKVAEEKKAAEKKAEAKRGSRPKHQRSRTAKKKKTPKKQNN